MVKLKVGITGHTQGLGAAFAEYFKEEEVHGFSRRNGWDLYNESSCNALIQNMKNFDIFINNAPIGKYQEYLFEGVLSNWLGQDKTIINVSSIAADITPGMMTVWEEHLRPEAEDKVGAGRTGEELIQYVREYVKSKRRLDKLTNVRTLEVGLQHENKPHILNLKPAATATELLGNNVFLNTLLDVEDFMSVFDTAWKIRDQVKLTNLTFIGTRPNPNK